MEILSVFGQRDPFKRNASKKYLITQPNIFVYQKCREGQFACPEIAGFHVT